MLDETCPPAAEENSLSECIVCFTSYDALFHLPKLLSCGHVFCLECLSRISVGSPHPDSLPCPICRLPTALLPRRGPLGLSTDQDLLKQMNKSPPSMRFSRHRGLLYVQKKTSLPLSSISLSVDLGRPPPPPAPATRDIRYLFRRGGCIFYGSLGLAVLLTIALILAGVYIFYLVPWNRHREDGQGVTVGQEGMNRTEGESNSTLGHRALGREVGF
ncbi:hypothetical protein FKM82_017813 [Ascaphus truei]|uniref:RING finger protein 225 n=1 Tax=Ascaphus truei TaxID=8439 RepID=UPI003F5946BC